MPRLVCTNNNNKTKKKKEKKKTLDFTEIFRVGLLIFLVYDLFSIV